VSYIIITAMRVTATLTTTPLMEEAIDAVGDFVIVPIVTGEDVAFRAVGAIVPLVVAVVGATVVGVIVVGVIVVGAREVVGGAVTPGGRVGVVGEDVVGPAVVGEAVVGALDVGAVVCTVGVEVPVEGEEVEIEGAVVVLPFAVGDAVTTGPLHTGLSKAQVTPLRRHSGTSKHATKGARPALFVKSMKVVPELIKLETSAAGN
jgi:hypothetical protein